MSDKELSINPLISFFTSVFTRKANNKLGEEIESNVIDVKINKYPEKDTFQIFYTIKVNKKLVVKNESIEIDVPKSLYSFQKHKTNITVARVSPTINFYKNGISASTVYINFENNSISIGNFLVISDIEVAKKIIGNLEITDEEFKNNVSRRLQINDKLTYKNQYNLERWNKLPKFDKNWVIQEIKNFKIRDKVLQKIEYLLHIKKIPSTLNVYFIDLLIEIWGKKLDKVTPLDIEFIDFDNELLKYLKNNQYNIIIRTIDKLQSTKNIYPTVIQSYIRKYLNGLEGSVRNIQELQDTNPLSSILQGSKIYFLKSRSSLADEKMDMNIDDFMGILDPVQTTEKKSLIVNYLTDGVDFKSGKLYIKVYDTLFIEKEIPLEEYLLNPILTYENINYRTKKVIKNPDNLYSCYLYGEYTKKPLEQIPYYRHMSTMVSASTSRIPFINKSYMGRSMYGAIQQGQSTTTIGSDVTIVDTGADYDVFNKFQGHIRAPASGIVVDYKDGIVSIEKKDGGIDHIEVKNEYVSTMTHNFNKYVPRFKIGDTVEKNDVLLSYNSFNSNGALKLTTPALVTFMTYHSKENNDSYIISQSFAKKLGIEEEYICEIPLYPNKYKIDINPVGKDIFEKLGLPKIGDVLHRNDKIFEYGEVQIHDDIGYVYQKIKGIPLVKAQTFYTPYEIIEGTVSNIEIIKLMKYNEEYSKLFTELENTIYNYRKNTLGKDFSINKEEYRDSEAELIIKIHVQFIRPITVGGKLSLLNGNKGTISNILKDEQMPKLKNGKIVDVIISPLATVPRMLGSQTYLLYLGKLAFSLYERLKKNDIDEDLIKALKVLFPNEKNLNSNSLLKKYGHNNFLRFKFLPYDSSLTIKNLKEIMVLCKVPLKEKVFDALDNVWVRMPMDVGYLDIMNLYMTASKKIFLTPTVLHTPYVRGYGKIRGYKGGNVKSYSGNDYGDNLNETLLAMQGHGSTDEFKQLLKNKNIDMSTKVISAFDQILLRLSTSSMNFSDIKVIPESVIREFDSHINDDCLSYELIIFNTLIKIVNGINNNIKYVYIPNLNTNNLKQILSYLILNTGKDIYNSEIIKAPLYLKLDNKFLRLK